MQSEMCRATSLSRDRSLVPWIVPQGQAATEWGKKEFQNKVYIKLIFSFDRRGPPGPPFLVLSAQIDNKMNYFQYFINDLHEHNQTHTAKKVPESRSFGKSSDVARHSVYVN
ncbi:hypothetical protein [Salipiger thiooxidans]|uniref:hypothetical protein n=1 Tax=Salipiger thiooxidans TaxID=282683 RepID=UPI001CD4DA58|nr:hypothetical protein [Salipiger thiooxidans]MCA0847558.1 hypothetical protein [Salipiger thiooxidans]